MPQAIKDALQNQLTDTKSQTGTKKIEDHKDAVRLALQMLDEVCDKREIDHFVMHRSLKKVFHSMVRYFNDDSSGPFDLTRGILLAGSNGTFKTGLMETFRRFSHFIGNKPFRIETSHDISDGLLANNDMAILLNYYDPREVKALCIDELGSESEINFWGSKIQPVKQIILQRYSKGLLTHGTTNLHPQRLQKKYGPRVESRVYSMFNLVYVNGEDYRKKSKLIIKND